MLFASVSFFPQLSFLSFPIHFNYFPQSSPSHHLLCFNSLVSFLLLLWWISFFVILSYFFYELCKIMFHLALLSHCNFFFWVLVIFLWNLWLIHLVILNSWQYAWPRFLSAWWQYFFYLLCFWPAICFFCSFFPKSIFKWFCLYPLENYYHTILIEVANHVCVSYLHKAYVGKCLSNIRIGSD